MEHEKRTAAHIPKLSNTEFILHVRIHTDFQNILLSENDKLQIDPHIITFIQMKQRLNDTI